MGGGLPAELGVLMVARNEVSASLSNFSSHLGCTIKQVCLCLCLSFLLWSFLFLVCVSFPPDLVNDDVRRVLVGLQK